MRRAEHLDPYSCPGRGVAFIVANRRLDLRPLQRASEGKHAHLPALSGGIDWDKT
jgi:hypothetical protein